MNSKEMKNRESVTGVACPAGNQILNGSGQSVTQVTETVTQLYRKTEVVVR
jgi:hypothetical protein